jgi:putative transposase
MIDLGHPRLSLSRQCGLIGLNRSSYYYEPAEESEENLLYMRLIDEQYMRTPLLRQPKHDHVAS